jgi:hypothetical protein
LARITVQNLPLSLLPETGDFFTMTLEEYKEEQKINDTE